MSRGTRSSGRRVEVEAQRSENTTLYANSDGSFTLVEQARPVRARRGERWVPIDLNLRLAGTVVEPVAAAVPLRLSAGGDGPLATVERDGWRLSLSWPGPLPAPTLSGAKATHPSVLPDVDLQVSVTDGGFSKHLVVSTREAAKALSQIRFGLQTSNVETSVSTEGSLQVRDRSGAVVFSAPPSIMWETAPAPGAPERTGRVGVPLVDGALILEPDQAFLASGRYPVTIDPSFSAGRLAWTTVMANHPDASHCRRLMRCGEWT